VTTEAVELLNELRNQALEPRNRRETLGLIDRVESLFQAQDTDLTTLHAELARNQQEFEQQRRELAEARAKLFFFEEQVRIRVAQMFGRHSEKWRREEQLQAILFNELELALQEAADSEPPPTEDEQQKQKKEARVAKRAENPEGGRSPLPDDLPRETTVIDIDESERTCKTCGKEKQVIGVEVLERLQMKPIEYVVERIERVVRACPAGCGCPSCVPPVPQVVPKSVIGATTAAQIITGKYCDALPLYRQERIFARDGIAIPRQTMARTVRAVAERLEPVSDRLNQFLLTCPVWGMDETRDRVLNDRGIKKDGQSWVWCTVGERPPPDNQLHEPPRRVVLFEYGPGRGGTVADRLLQNFHGILMTDDYGAYDRPTREAGIRHAACMAHVRRKFHDVLKADRKNRHAAEAMALIGRLYDVEREYAHATPADRLEARQKKSAPVLQEFREWLYRTGADITPKSALGQAVSYAIKNLDGLEVYLSDPWVPIDNNRVEQQIRSFAVGRKNWLFHHQAHGAEASARIYGIIATARANEIDPMHYLRFVLRNMERYHEAKMPWDNLLPFPEIRDYAATTDIPWALE
jgi:transposase